MFELDRMFDEPTDFYARVRELRGHCAILRRKTRLCDRGEKIANDALDALVALFETERDKRILAGEFERRPKEDTYDWHAIV